MFGDFGHGLLVLITGILLIKYEKAIKSRGYGSITDLRYLVLFLGFYAAFCGFIYNDFFGLPM